MAIRSESQLNANAIKCAFNCIHKLCNFSFTHHLWLNCNIALISGLFLRHKLTLNLYYILLLLFTSVSPTFTECQFPQHWVGNWFQNGVPESIAISRSNISQKGICRESNNEYNKFLIEDRNDRCVRCLVINERHSNVLQYKETYSCEPLSNGKLSLEKVCSSINGDAPLYSLFRLGTRAVTCPFHGSFTFSYSQGRGVCRDPISEIEPCTDDRHLLFKFKACADVYGSESRVEILECFAEWRDSSSRYLVGKLHHDAAKTDEDKFRCFVFDKIKDEPDGYEIAQSGDATCDGLVSPKEGSRTMKLHKTLGTIARCQFPQWLTAHRHWKSLDDSLTYDFSRLNNSFSIYNITSGGEIVRNGVCIHHENMSNNAFNISQITIYFTSGCKSGYVCMRIYQRTNQIIEIQYGNAVLQSSDACSQTNHFAKYEIFTVASSETRECPIEGIYAVSVPSDLESHTNPSTEKTLFICSEQSSLNSRCDSNDHMTFQSRCSYSEATRNFKCRGGWKENNTNYLIAISEEDRGKYCLTYNEDENELKMTISSEMCHRPHANTFRESRLALSLVNKGLCTSGTSIHIISVGFVLKILIVIKAVQNLLLTY